MATSHPHQRYLSAKELSSEFESLGLRPCSYRAMLALIGDAPSSVGTQIKLADAISFLRDNPTWQPQRKGHHASALQRTAAQSPSIVSL